MKRSGAIYFLFALLAVGLGISAWMAQPFLSAALLALLFSIGFSPLHKTMRRWLKGPSAAALASTLLVGVAVLLPLGILAALFADNVAEEYAHLRSASDGQGGLAALVLDSIKPVLTRVAGMLHMNETDLNAKILMRLQEIGQNAFGVLANLLIQTGSWVANFFLACLLLFFFFRDGAKMRNGILHLLPLSAEDSDGLLNVIHDTIAANFNGVLGVALVQGVLTGFGLAIARAPSPFLAGFVAGLFSLVPMIGPPIVWIPMVIWLLVQGSVGWAIFLLVWCVVVVGLSDNVLRPWLVGGQTNQHPLLVFFSLLGGTAAFGVSGIFIGPLVVSITIAVWVVLRRELSEP
jgi:predicted PurR-regulated permease PerM